MTKWVNIYEVERCYGGPEEGGWYYDNYSCVCSEQVDEGQAERTREQYEEEYAYINHGDISSVLGGTKLAVLIEDEEAESETQESPHYE